MNPLDCTPPTDPARSYLMRRVRQRGTSAEGRVAVVLRGLGLFSPEKRTISSGIAGFREQDLSLGGVCERLFLAPSLGLRARHRSDQEQGVLGGKVRSESDP